MHDEAWRRGRRLITLGAALALLTHCGGAPPDGMAEDPGAADVVEAGDDEALDEAEGAEPVETEADTVHALAGEQVLTFRGAADARVELRSPATNFGSTTRLRADASPATWSYLRFNLTGLDAKLASGWRLKTAHVRLYATSASRGYVRTYEVPTTWSSTRITWNSRPRLPDGHYTQEWTSQLGAIAANTWQTAPIYQTLIRRHEDTRRMDGTYSWALVTELTDGVSFVSLNSSWTSRRPRLVVVLEQDSSEATAAAQSTQRPSPGE
jgi:hypothetical protein